MADVFIGLATAVVKAGVKIWLKDDSFAANVSASVADFVAGKINDDLDQRKIRRFFEDLEIPVANRLRALRQTEFSSLPENEWNAAVLATSDSFDRAHFTARDLFVRDLDPLFLEHQIRPDRSRATRDLSDGGTALYDRLVAEGCAYVIEIADKLPHFQTNAFAELLQRDRQILKRIDEVLERIPHRAIGDSDEARFVTACRRHIATRLDRLELFGLDFESNWYPLSVAYVSLRTEQRVDAGEQAIEDRLAANARTMLVGRAGSGKTTVLQWLAVCAARSAFTGSLSGFNDHFPFFIRLRDYVGAMLPTPEEFLFTTARLLIDETPRGWVRAMLDSGRALVLIDGVDELPATERDRVAQWLSDLTGRFPSATYVVTARPTAVSPTWLAEIGFVRSSLEAMPPSLVHAFVRNWHEATRQQLRDAEERERLDGYERSLLANVTKDRYLRDLADTPLLAGLLCALNRHLRSNLPRRRSEIYERALTMFDQRDQARSVHSSQVSIDLTAKTHLLAALALWMIRNGESEVDSAVAAEQISRSLAGMPSVNYPADDAYSFLLERSGLLRQPAAERVDFVHRTFQEYLAAKAAIDSDMTGELVSNAGNDQWGEVVVFAAGQANQAQLAQLLQGLLRRNRRGQQRYGRNVLAVACLQEVRSLEPRLRREVEAVIPDLLPPRSMEQAEQLSTAGESLIPQLARHWTRDTEKARETIRAASLIGGPDAMTLIKDVALQTETPDVIAEIQRAWQYFDIDNYAQDVLAAIEIEDLYIPSAKYIQALAHIPSIKILRIEPGCHELINLDVPASLPRLERISIPGYLDASELSKLAACDTLTFLNIEGYPYADLSPLQRLRGLKVLHVRNSQELRNLTGLHPASEVFEISLTDCSKIIALRDLCYLRNLRRIGFRNISDLSLSGFKPTMKTMICLAECGEVDLSPLLGVETVTILYYRTRLKNAWYGSNYEITKSGELSRFFSF